MAKRDRELEYLLMVDICKDFKVTHKQLISKTRKSDIVIARRVIANVFKHALKYGTRRTALILNKKDHTTIVNYLRKDKIDNKTLEIINYYTNKYE